ncbi:hypothetical protein [Flavisolibacter nicotianae]|uniref:hypothetical protein n=1 Tax=Flavisolibacter nicotianae TaxID=2364882 RepID=UPI0013C3EE3C|nr:hypothetical protein [Flavisolibacter nicotianae]
MQNELLISLSKSYSDLLPQNKESLLLIVWLYRKVEKNYINEDFEQKDLNDTIDEIVDFLKIETEKNKENLSRKLSSYFFITERIGNKYQIHLTVYAKEFCKLVLTQVQPELKKLELYHVFKRTLPLHDGDLENIDNLKYWFDNNFRPARNEILAHTELLQTSIELRLNDLRTLLKPDVENPKELINSFLEIFKELENQTSGLINTIDHKNDTLNKIKSSKDKFLFEEEAYLEFCRMQNEIEFFFQSIDRRIIAINHKIQLASKRLRNLLDTLKHKQYFKINIEKLLLIMLRTSTVDKGEISIHQVFPKKLLPFIPTKFLAVPNIDFQFYSKSEPEKNVVDKEYEEMEREKGLKMLEVQESTAKWIDKISQEIESGVEVDFDLWFDKILSQEKNLEVPIQVCFGLIESYNNSNNKSISIQKEKVEKTLYNIALWRMKLQSTPS